MTRPNNQPLAIVGPYELIERIGAGGMGSVYRARNSRDGRVVALKLMHEHVASDPSYAERFRREAAVAALIDSDNVVRVLEFASDGGRPYIVTEYVEGESLEARLHNGRLPIETAAVIARDVANALAAAGRRNVVHRDIKPANILIASDGTARVTDFGIATLNQGSSLTIPGMFVGTAAYAAPEQHHGAADIRSDIYALGVVLFEMVTGSLPFAGSTATEMLRQHESGRVPVERLRDQPPQLAGAIARCLEKSPSRRYQSPEALANDLARFAVPQPEAIAGETVVFASPSETVMAGTVFAPAAMEQPGAEATRVAPALLETGEHAVAGAAVPLAQSMAVLREKVRATPMFTRALGAAAGIACVTMLAMFGVRGGHGQEPPVNAGSGGGSSIQPIDFGGSTPSPVVTETATATSTVTPKKPRPGVTETAVPSVTATATSTPPPTVTVAPTKPAPTTPPPPPAPSLEVVDWAFCHQPGCPYGDQYLYAGYPIAIAFQLNQPTSQGVSVEVWFDGEYQYTSNFTASSNGAYYDLLPYANYAGELELDIYVGGSYLDSLYADVN